MKKGIVFLYFLFSFLTSYSQKDDLSFLVDQIKANYAGYKDKTTDAIFDKFVLKTISQNRGDTFKIMALIVDFFHDRHLDLFKEGSSNDGTSSKKDLKNILEYLETNKRPKQYEGFWINDRNRAIIAIKQTRNYPLQYKAYTIECIDTNAVSFPGDMVYEFDHKQANLFLTKAKGGKRGWTFYLQSVFRNDSIIVAGPYNKWRKVKKYRKHLLNDFPKRSIDTATGYWLDSNNYVITIPGSFDFNGPIVDSLIKANPAISKSLKNLIIDVRGNTGGTVRAFSALFPLLYTGPILKVNGYVYCTKSEIENNKALIADYIAKGNIDSSELKEAIDWTKLEEDNFGKFLALPQDTLRYDSIMPYPQRVAFLMDYGCQSATEMTILEAQQSKKVTLFGEHTMGAVDYFDFAPYPLPSKKYTLYIAATKRIIPPGGHKLDGVGIQPDVHIDDSNSDWIDFVRRYYEKN